MPNDIGQSILDTHPQQFLRTQIRAIEAHIKAELDVPRAARDPIRGRCLRGALDELACARQELARCPDGARLAVVLMQVVLEWRAPDVDFARGRYDGSLKGITKMRQTRHANAAELHAQIREAARGLTRENSVSAKARRLAGRPEFKSLAERTIRGILAK